MFVDQRNAGIFRNIVNRWEVAVDSVTLGVNIDERNVVFGHVFKCPSVVAATVDLKFIAQRIGSERQRSAGVFFFDATH